MSSTPTPDSTSASSSPPRPAQASLATLLRSYPTATLPPRDSNDTVRIPGRWSDTLPSSLTFGYGPGSKGKGKGRARIPLWGKVGGGDEGETDDDDARSGKGDEGGITSEGAIRDKEERQRKDKELDELAERILYQAGSDSSSPPGPLLILAPVNLPPPTELSHTELLARLAERLETFAQTGPYSVVLLATPTPHAPPTQLLVSTYLSLSRLARKNVQRVFVVGAGWWIRVLLTLFTTTLLSGKTAKKRKIVQCANLSSLAKEMGVDKFTGIEFPLEVYSAYAAFEPTIALPPMDPPHQPLFGTSLERLMGPSAELGLPALVRECLVVLQEEGPDSIGIFRRSPSAATVKILEGAYNRGHPVTLVQYPDSPYIASSLLKLFLRLLPSPIFPPSFYPLARLCPLPTSTEDPTAYIRETILPLLSPPALLLLRELTRVLNLIALEAKTSLMTADNLVVCVCPGLLGGVGTGEEELEMCRVPGMEMGSMRGLSGGGSKKDARSNTLGGVLKVMIERHEEVFSASGSSIPSSGIPPPIRVASDPASPLRSPRLPLTTLFEDGNSAAPSALDTSTVSPSSSPPLSRQPSFAASTIRRNSHGVRSRPSLGEVKVDVGAVGEFVPPVGVVDEDSDSRL